MLKTLYEWMIRPIDGYLFSLLLVITLISLTVLYSASGQSLDRLNGQVINFTVGFIVMWTFSNMPVRYLQNLALPTYIFGVLLLLAVALFGDISHGARRWLHVGVTRIQPSEMLKIAVPLMLSWFFDRHHTTLKLRNYAIALILLMIPVGFILKQPDLGTAMLVSAAGIYVIFLAGISWRVIIFVLTMFAISLPIFWSMLHDYQRQRVLTLIDPTTDPLGTGYHIIQSMIAVGSGGIPGKGWLHGTQTHLDFLPERTTDFIFAVFAEEFGLLGNGILLILYTLVIGRGLLIAVRAPTWFTRLLAGSITLTFFNYAFVNMGMVSGILPVVGVPLPLVSYGGTSIVTLMLGFGILMSIESHRKRLKTSEFNIKT